MYHTSHFYKVSSMARSLNKLEVDILAGLGPKERVLALLRSRSQLDARGFAIRHGIHVGDFYQMLRGQTPHHAIRDHLTTTLALTRVEIDRLIDGEPAVAAADTPAATS